MYGDFSRDSFDPSKQYTRVLMQQGRPLTDADWNEQVAILLQEQRDSIMEIVGWHGSADNGFGLAQIDGVYTLQQGSYFVDGIRCVNLRLLRAVLNGSSHDLVPNNDYLIYLRVWDESINAINDSQILEPALGGLQTSLRSARRWSVDFSTATWTEGIERNRSLLTQFICTGNEGTRLQNSLRARMTPRSATSSVPCADLSRAFAGKSDRLYRIEVHRRGTASANGVTEPATFKWSRNNGSTVLPLVVRSDDLRFKPAANTDGRTNRISGATSDNPRSRPSTTAPVVLQIRREDSTLIEPGDWIEIIDCQGTLHNKDGQLLKVDQVTADAQVMCLGQVQMVSVEHRLFSDETLVSDAFRFYLRKWDSLSEKTTPNVRTGASNPGDSIPSRFRIADDGAVLIVADNWVDLDDGIQIKFSGEYFCPGDYWLIRTTTSGNIHIWPTASPDGCSFAQRPYHFAPIGILTINQDRTLAVTTVKYRNTFKRLVADDTDSYSSERQCPPPSARPAVADPANVENPAPENGASPAPPATCSVSLLSSAGKLALKRYAASPTGLTRRIPARYLNHETTLPGLRRWLRTALVSEIHEPTFERFFEKVLRSVAIDEDHRSQAEVEAREVYNLATSLYHVVSSGGGIRDLIA